MHAHQMSDAEILLDIAADPRMSHVLDAAHRDPATIEREPGVDPMHIDQVRQRHADRQAYLATLPPRKSFVAEIFNAIAGELDKNAD